ncbi:phospholipid scramblase 1-like [Haliotis rufescens]|uniref:phospholipid scramblase 1-like n=1 Tax=Haliotis rufescens TaxID=6454 RepID=UPI00201E9A49|nr:phospholipid scramblase 1-like [Haliotis rufescens]
MMSAVDQVISAQPESGEKTTLTADTDAGGYQPLGLKDLTKTNVLRVHQYLDVLEVLLGWERSNRYQICDADGKQILYGYEVGVCLARKVLGSSRGLVLKFSDNESQDVISLHRPLRCSTRCCWMCCHLQEMAIHSPPGTPIGTVREIWSCGAPVYNVYNLKEGLLYTIVGDCCHCRACGDVTFHVYEGPREKEDKVADLSKHWTGCRDIIGAANDFSLTYIKDIGVKDKLTIFGAVFLIGFNYFEKHCRC